MENLGCLNPRIPPVFANLSKPDKVALLLSGDTPSDPIDNRRFLNFVGEFLLKLKPFFEAETVLK